jgi:transposase-like protein
MFFDLQEDPGEMKNLVADKVVAGELDHHRQLLAQWRKTTEEDQHLAQANPKAQRRKAKR